MDTVLIGITTYHRDEKGYTRLPGEYVDAIRRAGGIPLLIMPGEPHLGALMGVLDGLILSGGGDVDPARYGKPTDETIENVDQERDDAEFAIAKEALAADVPMFCICRGMQLLNVALGGTLITDLGETELEHRQPPDKPYGSIPHGVTVAADSNLAQIMGSETVTTASWHHQAIDKLADELRVVAESPDGIIEAVEMANKPVIAVQWHPELTAANDPSQQKLFDELVRMARERKE